MIKFPSTDEIYNFLSDYLDDGCDLLLLGRNIKIEKKDYIINFKLDNYCLSYDLLEGKIKDNELMLFLDETWKKNYSIKTICAIILSQLTRKIIDN